MQLEVGFGEFVGGFGALDNARAGKQPGLGAVDLRTADADDQLTAALRVDPAERTGEEPARETFECRDVAQGGFTRFAADGGRGVQHGSGVQDVPTGRPGDVQDRSQVLDVAELEQARRRRFIEGRPEGAHAGADGGNDSAVLAEVPSSTRPERPPTSSPRPDTWSSSPET